jgi:DNA-binding CsgD family transcriptional regulator
MTTAMLDGVFLRVAEAQTRDDILGALMAFAHRHDCGSGDLVVVMDRPGGETVFESIHFLPDAYLSTYFTGDAKSDPVMQHVKHSSRPIIWSQETYVHAGKGEAWEGMARCGLVAGASLATHLPQGRHLILSLDWPRTMPEERGRMTGVVSEMHLFAAHAVESAFGVMSTVAASLDDEVRLSARELEVLQWTAAGKTAWETGQILSIAERTVVKHAASAATKLGCCNKHQAAVKAVQLKLIN